VGGLRMSVRIPSVPGPRRHSRKAAGDFLYRNIGRLLVVWRVFLVRRWSEGCRSYFSRNAGPCAEFWRRRALACYAFGPVLRRRPIGHSAYIVKISSLVRSAESLANTFGAMRASRDKLTLRQGVRVLPKSWDA